MKTRFRLAVLIALLWCVDTHAATIFKDPFEIPEPVELRVVITPGAQLLTSNGQSATLSAQVLDGNDQPAAVDVTWESLNPSAVSIDGDGLITAQASIGTAQIVARAPGALPAKILVTIANPVDGAILVDDASVVAAPTPLDPEAPVLPGYQYAITLNTSEPEVGSVIIGTGAIPMAGRVLSKTVVGDGTDLILELLEFDQLFDEFVINEKITLSDLPIVLPEQLADDFSATRLSDGSYVLSPAGQSRQVSGTSISQFVSCETSLTNWQNIFTLNLSDSITIDPTLNLDVQYNQLDGLQRLVVNGGVSAAYDMTVRTQAAFEGKLTCKFQVGRIPIPVGGVFSLLFRGEVPLGVGIEVSGKVSSTEPAGYDLTATGNANFTAGVDCSAGCALISDLSVGADGTARLIEPPVDVFLSNFQLDLNGYLFAYADLDFRNPFLSAIGFKALGVQAGIQQSGSFRSIAAQVADAAYASEFKLEAVGSAGAASDLASLLATFNIILPPTELFKISSLLAQSPKGTLNIAPSEVEPGDDSELGDLASFTVNLNPTTYLGSYNVEEVAIYWQKPGGAELQLNRPGCNTLVPAGAQTSFSCETDYLEEDVGQQQFYAFVKASAYGVPVPFWLEVSPNSLANLLVGFDSRYSHLANVDVGYSDKSQDLDDFDGLPDDNAGEVDVSIVVPNVATVVAEASSYPGELSARARATTTVDGAGNWSARVTGNAAAGFDLPFAFVNDTSEPITISVTFTLNGTVSLNAAPDDKARAVISVGADTNTVAVWSEIKLCRPSLNGESTCDEGETEGFGFLVGYEGGPLTFTLGPQTIQPGEKEPVNASIFVQARAGADIDLTLTTTSLD